MEQGRKVEGKDGQGEAKPEKLPFPKSFAACVSALRNREPCPTTDSGRTYKIGNGWEVKF